MKVQVETREIESHGIQSKKNYTIFASAKAFKILSSSLYKNKIKAIVRELGCNAYDAHVSIGRKDLPFEIHLPNHIEPHFSVKDFGPGLDQAAIEEIYTTYFLSTKTNSNDYIGALGLGSKSPFSYVDSYTTISRFNGTKYTYVAALGEGGEPTLNLLNCQTTDEPNGLEVIVPVNAVDFQTFANEASHIFRWFDVKPNSNMIVRYPENTKMIEGTGWCSVSKQFSPVSCVTMGNISYPIDTAQIYHQFLQDFCKTDKNITIFANIGDVDFTAGREDLSYDKTTIAWIMNSLDRIQAEYESVVEEKIKNADSLRHAHILYKEYVSGYTANSFKTVLKYGDQTIGSVSPFVDFEEYPGLRIKIHVRSKGRYKIKEYSIHSGRHEAHLPTENEHTFAFDNFEKGNVTKFRNRKNNTSAYTHIFVTLETNDSELKRKIIEKYTGYNFETISEWVKPVRAPRQKSGLAPVQNQKLSMLYKNSLNQFSLSLVDLDAGGLIVDTSPGKNGVSAQGYLIDRKPFDDLNDIFFKDVQIIAPRKSMKLKMGNKWLNYSDALKEKIIEYFKNPDHVLECHAANGNLSYETTALLKSIAEANLNKNHFLYPMGQMILKTDSKYIYRRFVSVINSLKIEIPELLNLKKEMDEFMKKLNSDYPVLQYIRNAPPKEISNYILMCDNYKKEAE